MCKVRGPNLANLRRWFVRRIYATHNDSEFVRQALSVILETLGPDENGLNIGCGTIRIHSRVLNIDIARTSAVDCLADVQHLPFRSEVFVVIVTQETLEHVADPFRAVREISRVLRSQGVLYCQVPFIIGYHPGPTDFWRFTREGIQQLVEQAGLRYEKIGMSVGPGTGFYRILLEFLASSVGRVVPDMYIPVKALCALALFPLKWLDPLLSTGPQADRVAGGYFLIARKD